MTTVDGAVIKGNRLRREDLDHTTLGKDNSNKKSKAELMEEGRAVFPSTTVDRSGVAAATDESTSGSG